MNPLQTVLDALTRRGCSPRRSGAAISARCPAHEDATPSLSVTEGDGERVLVTCHAGCEFSAIASALGLRDEDLFPPSDRRKQILECYPYEDEHGNLLYEVVRYEPKGFAVRRPDGKGGWIWKLGGIPRVLYRLPEVKEAIQRKETVFVVEGEKDVETLRRAGLTATCNLGGAASGTGTGKWRESYAIDLTGADVVVLPDLDPPGRAHAEVIARSLAGRAARVRVVEVLSGKDVSDWFALGASRPDLESLIARTPDWKPIATLEERPRSKDRTTTQAAAPGGASPPRTYGALALASSPALPAACRYEPIETPLDAYPAPIDSAAFHGLAGVIARAIEPHTEADPVAVLAQFLVMFGSAIGRSAHARVGATRHFGIEFLGIVGETGKGRKGTSFEEAMRPFRLIEDPWTGRVTSGLSSGEGLIWAVRDPIEKQEPIREKAGAGNGGRGPVAGYETLVVDPGVEDKRLLVVEPEYGRVLRVMDRDGNTLSGVTRSLWDCQERASTMTKNSPAAATGAHISIIGHITRDELLRYLDRTETANGWGNRHLWIAVRRSKELPEGGSLTDEALRPLAVRLREALAFARETGEVTRDDDARAMWRAVYGPLSSGRPGLFGAITGRAEAHVTRLAVLHALLDCSAIVRVPHLEAALALWTYAEDSGRYIFGESLGDPVADEIRRALRGAPDGLTRSDLFGLFGRNVSAGQISRALEVLMRNRLACGRRETSPTGGRPIERWFSGPDLPPREGDGGAVRGLEQEGGSPGVNSSNSFTSSPEAS